LAFLPQRTWNPIPNTRAESALAASGWPKGIACCHCQTLIGLPSWDLSRAAGAVTILVGGAVLAEQPHMSADRDRHNNLAAEIERN